MTRMHWIERAPVLSATRSRRLGLDHAGASSVAASPATASRPRRAPHRRRHRRRPSAASARVRPGWAAPWIASEVAVLVGHDVRRAAVLAGALDDLDQRASAWSPTAAAISSIRTVSPTWASFSSSWALNLRRQADDALVERVARQALDGHDDRLVHLVADDAADLRLPLALHRGGCSCHRVISLTPSSRRRRWRSRWTVRIRAIVRRVCGIVL